ncbi:tyrosine-type recombinase/integrase [Micromonospora sicca]|uniref:tyrosine-type recombinase/integrase n=1 Tax=Micromonospora sicca TaxID=2202420 RepID=UPI0011B5A97C|nr:tyrosine-type recombinase/integrase [Micromonospora sp. 4G51]
MSGPAAGHAARGVAPGARRPTRPCCRCWPACRRCTPAALLLNQRGGRLSPRGAHDILLTIADEAGITADFTGSHVLRHTFGTCLVREGHDIILVAELMGHARLETTQAYSLPTDGRRRPSGRGCRLARARCRGGVRSPRVGRSPIYQTGSGTAGGGRPHPWVTTHPPGTCGPRRVSERGPAGGVDIGGRPRRPDTSRRLLARFATPGRDSAGLRTPPRPAPLRVQTSSAAIRSEGQRSS